MIVIQILLTVTHTIYYDFISIIVPFLIILFLFT